MRKEYDFSKAKRNPYAKRLKRQVTIRLDHGTIAYFKALAEETGIRYQTLINLYLRDCAATQKKLAVAWRATAAKGQPSRVCTRRRADVNRERAAGDAQPLEAARNET